MPGKRSLWRERDFVLLWSGQTVSMLGSEVTLVALPLVAGLCETFFNPAYQTYPRVLLGPERLLEGNAKLSLSTTGAASAGPSLGGVLIQAFGPAKAMLADAVSFFAAAAAIWRIRAPEPRPEPRQGATVRADIVEGVRYVLRNRLIRPIAISGAVFSFVIAIPVALSTVYAARELHWSPLAIGLVSGLSALGGVLGGLVAERLAKRYGMTRTMLGASLVYAVCDLVLPLVSPGLLGQVLVGLGWTVLLAGAIVLNVTQRSFRQLVTPLELQGRLAATMRWMAWSCAPLGALLGGALAEAVGMRTTLLVAGLACGLGTLVLWLSPLRTMRQDPATVAE
ncbi:MFS transporter [Thermoactinospora rubra]|uniref:MFS transporter n=1 Tax=Thermoactinospora rubra TaxID=1088767 RepID=UPI001301F21D|nr:MFS transporter [Thermoactinospora rubra]